MNLDYLKTITKKELRTTLAALIVAVAGLGRIFGLPFNIEVDPQTLDAIVVVGMVLIGLFAKDGGKDE